MNLQEKKLYSIFHFKYGTDNLYSGETLVRGYSKQDAMDKLNNFLKTKPYDNYTPELCKSINDVHDAEILDLEEK